MRPHCGSGGSSNSRTASDRGATAHASTTPPAARLARRKPPLKAKTEFSCTVVHKRAEPATPRMPATPANVLNHRRWLPSRHNVSPMEIAAPTSSAWALQSVP